MSFSSKVKNDLCRLEIKDKCCLLAELASVMAVNGTIKVTGNEVNVRIVTENAAFARNIFSTIKNIFNIYPEILIRKSRKLKKHTLYILILPDSKGARLVLERIGITLDPQKDTSQDSYFIKEAQLLKKSCCKKTYLRGAFLAGGSVSDPEKTYHLEITMHSRLLAKELNLLINGFGLNSKVIRRKGNYVVYLKEGENIVDFLNIIGAHTALMELENIRILKDMRNNVNRIVNCETANLDKTINASMRQIENIKYIRDKVGFGKLPDNLREMAELRLTYSDANLKELGELFEPPLGKSGVNHRLRKLDKIAEEARNLKGEL